MKKLFLLLMLIGLPLFGKTTYEPVFGKVVGVTDGDTVKILSADVLYKVRLHGIDAPEMRQAYGQESKQHLSDLCFGKNVKLQIWNKDRYGRFVGRIYVGEVCINDVMIEDGFAWAYRQYLGGVIKKVYILMESQARQKGLGLWADKNPVEPWNFRRNKK